jgi:hypothetical protein
MIFIINGLPFITVYYFLLPSVNLLLLFITINKPVYNPITNRVYMYSTRIQSDYKPRLHGHNPYTIRLQIAFTCIQSVNHTRK